MPARHGSASGGGPGRLCRIERRRGLVARALCASAALLGGLAALAGPAPRAEAANGAAFVSMSAPTSMITGETRTISVRMLNTGDTTWTRAQGHRLGSQSPQDNTTWGLGRVELTSAEAIAPGAEKVFTFAIQAPASPGSYALQWRMLQEGVEWFGEYTSVQTVQVNAATVSLQVLDGATVVPQGGLVDFGTVTTGASTTHAFTVVNQGNVTVTVSPISLGSNVGDPGTFSVASSSLDDLPPGGSGSLTLGYTADQPGTTVNSVRLFVGGISRFEFDVRATGRKNGAAFVSQAVPTSLTTGETYTVQVTMLNTGDTTWTRAGGYGLGSQSPQDNTTWGTGRVLLGAFDSVAPGAQAQFSFTIRAPDTAGSYAFQWRMIETSVEWFGEKTALQTIQVVDPPPPPAFRVEQNSALVPEGSLVDFGSVLLGQSTSRTFTVVNEGTGTLTVSPIGLASSAGQPGTFSVTSNQATNLAPGASGTFTLQFTAGTSGVTTYTARLFVDGVSRYEFDVRGTGVANDAQFVSQDVPTSLVTGQTYTARVTMSNVGDTTWTRAGGYELGSQSPQDNQTWGFSRVLLDPLESVAPGAQKQFSLAIQAPAAPGAYDFQWRMLQQGVQRFGELTPKVTIQVVSPPPALHVEHDGSVVPDGGLSDFGATLVGGSITRSFTIHNDGSQGFSVTPSLGGNVSDPGTFSFEASPSGTIPPGGSGTLTLRYDATARGTTTNDLRLFIGGISRYEFGVRATGQVNDAAFVAQVVPASLTVGEARAVSVTMTNTGDTTWTRADGYKLGSQSPQGNQTWGLSRVLLGHFESVAPGGQKQFSFTIQAPDAPGTYDFQWRMLRENVQWFGELTPRVAIEVVPIGPILRLELGGVVISPGETVEFGETGPGQDVTQTFTVWNDGDQTLEIPQILVEPSATDPNDFAVDGASSLSVPPGASGTFTVRFVANEPGTSQRTLSLERADGPSFDFEVRGVVRTPEFTLELDPTSRQVLPGGTAAYTVQVRSLFGFDETVDLSVSGLGSSELTAEVSPPAIAGSGDAQLQLEAGGMAAPGVYAFTVTGQAPGLTRQVQGSLELLVPPGPPEVDGVVPDILPGGEITVVTVTGANFQGATLSIPTDPPDPDDPGPARAFPLASVLDITPDGTQLQIQVDARDPEVMDYYNIVVDNGVAQPPEEREPVQVRVVPPGPLVDLWTPANPERGASYVMSLVGFNLSDVTVAVSVPGVRILGSDNSQDDRFNALLDVSDAAPLGPAELIVTGPQGHTLRLPVDIALPGSSSLNAQPLMGETGEVDENGRALGSTPGTPTQETTDPTSGDEGPSDADPTALSEPAESTSVAGFTEPLDDGRSGLTASTVTESAETTSELDENGRPLGSEPEPAAETTTETTTETVVPLLLMQDFSLRLPQTTSVTAEGIEVRTLEPGEAVSGASIDFTLFFVERFTLIDFRWERSVSFDPLTGELGDEILKDLPLGARVPFGTVVFAFSLRVDLTVFWYYTFGGQLTFPSFCIDAVAVGEIPGSVVRVSVALCAGGLPLPSQFGTTTTITAEGGPCASVVEGGPTFAGGFEGVVEQNDCCEQPIRTIASGTNAFGGPWSVDETSGETTPISMCTTSCDVDIIAPAACVPVSTRDADLVVYRAQSTGGGTFTWSSSSSKIALTNPTSSGADSQVEVRGVSASAVADDVRLRVDFDNGRETCFDEVDLSSIAIQMGFRAQNGQTLDPMFVPPAFPPPTPILPEFGFPALGHISALPHPTDPSFARWGNNMEIKATITPCDPNLRCTFDFQRFRTGTAGFLFPPPTAGGSWTFQPGSSHCPAPQSCFDDDPTADDRDEDLVLDPAPGCGIFVLDAPGEFRQRTCLAQDEGARSIHCMSFTEHLAVDGQPVEATTLEWQSSTRVKCESQVVVEDSGGQGNRIVQGRSLNCQPDGALDPPP